MARNGATAGFEILRSGPLMHGNLLRGLVSVPHKGLLLLLAGVFTLSFVACGCTISGKLFPKKPPQDEIISSRGIVAPREKLARWREMANKARNPAERQVAIAHLHAAFSSEADPQLRGEILRLLERVEGGLNAAILQEAAKDPDPNVRRELCRITARHQSPLGLSILGQLALEDPDRDVRLAAIKALGQYRDPQATQVLGRVLRDRDPAVQYFAVQSLKSNTHQDFGLDIDRWEAFVMSNRAAVDQRPSIATKPRSTY